MPDLVDITNLKKPLTNNHVLSCGRSANGRSPRHLFQKFDKEGRREGMRGCDRGQGSGRGRIIIGEGKE